METREIVLLVVVVLVLLAVVAALMAAQRRKREQLRSTFGSEYDRTLDSTGRRRDAERDLAERAERRSSLDIRPLPAADRQAFAARWTATQADFVDRPAEAVTSADRLVSEVMQQRGYPVGDFDQQARDVSVDHAEVVQEYRAAHDISLLNDRREATTEQLRQAMVHYRALFTELLGNDDVAQAAPPVYPTDDRSRTSRDLPDHDLSDRDLAYLERNDRDAGGDRTQGSHERARVQQIVEHQDDRRPAATDDDLGRGGHELHPDDVRGRDLRDSGGSYDDLEAGPRTGHPASHDAGYDPARDERDETRAAGTGYAPDDDRRTREGGLLADREQQQVLHVRRERLDEGADDRDLPPRG